MATDLPPSVPELQHRLQLARQKFAEQRTEINRLIARCERDHHRRVEAERQVQDALLILAGDADSGSESPVCVFAREATGVAAGSVTNAAKAARRLKLIRDVHRLLGTLPKPVNQIAESIGDRQEWARLLAELRAEANDEG